MARVLVVDDEKSIRVTTSAFLKKAGHEVDCAQDADEAIELLMQRSHDVVVTDIVMPRISGIELLSAIRHASPSVRVIVMTGYPTLDTAKSALTSGANDYLYKPFTKDDIIRAVGKASAEKEKEEQKAREDVKREQYESFLREEVQKKARAARASENLYQSLVEASPDAILVTDRNLNCILLNERFLGDSGFDSELDLIGMSFLTRFAEENRDVAERDFRAVMEGAAQGTKQYDLVKQDGSVYPAEIRCSVIREANGEIRGMIFVCRDVSERTQARRRLRLLTEALHQSFDGALITDPEGLAVYANPAWRNMHQMTEDEILGQHFRMFHAEEQFKKSVLPFLEELGRKGQNEQELLHRRKNGEEFLARTATSAVTDEKGRVIAWVTSAHDVSREKKLAAKLQQAQKMEAIGTLAGGIAHDFNNILCSIIGFAELTLPQQAEGTVAHKNISAILKAGNRAKELVKQIHAFSRPGDQVLVPVQVHLIVNESLKLLHATLPANIEIEKDIQSKAMILAEPTEIHQVVMNLYTNAYQAMIDTGGTLSVNLREETLSADEAANRMMIPGDFVVLTVSDTGHGIHPENMDRIFDPYFTTKKNREGTGLGLAITRSIVAKTGGRIEVNSQPGAGTTFTVYFRKFDGKAQRTAKAKPEATLSGRERILVVDDEVMVLKMLSQSLEVLGYQVVQHSDPEEALRFFESPDSMIDLVITDMNMPKVMGDELSRRIVAASPGTPVLLCTGYNDKITPEQAREVGILSIVYKPYNTREIAMTIRELLDKRPT
ncbi:MAG: response regulator [Thermodesulfobacteriota bacterium]